MALMAQKSPLEIKNAMRARQHKETKDAILVMNPFFMKADQKVQAARKGQQQVDALLLEAKKIQQEVDTLHLEATDLKAKGNNKKRCFEEMESRHVKEAQSFYLSLPPDKWPRPPSSRRRTGPRMSTCSHLPGTHDAESDSFSD